MNKKQFFLIIFCVVLRTKCIINPLLFYTPYNSVVQVIQQATNTVLAPIPTNAAPSSFSSTPSPSDTQITVSPTAQVGQNITAEGNYTTTNCINYDGATDSECAILISKSNTTIDLNGQTLAFTGATCSNNINTISGIKIAAGITNVTIKNGTISNFPGAGIDGTEESSTVRNHLTLESVKIISCYQGIHITNSQNLLISNCTIAGTINPTGTSCGITIEKSVGVTLKSCVSQNNISSTGNCYGFMLNDCQTTCMFNCMAQNNRGSTTTAGIYFLNMVNNNYIDSCISNGNSSTTGEAHGILLEQSTQTFIQNSSAHCNTAHTPCHAYGIRLLGSTTNFIKHNALDCNDYGIYDDEPAGQHTNIFSQNSAYHNKITDYLRPFSSPLSFVLINQEHLQGMLLAGELANISIRITS